MGYISYRTPYSESNDLKIVGLKLFELNSIYTINYCYVYSWSTNSIGTKIIFFWYFDKFDENVKTSLT